MSALTHKIMNNNLEFVIDLAELFKLHDPESTKLLSLNIIYLKRPFLDWGAKTTNGYI
jgi:hypothetical protein